jgi:hypothetical protein
MPGSGGFNLTSAWRVLVSALVALTVAAAIPPPAVAQNATSVPRPRLAPTTPPAPALRDEGGPGQADLPPGSGDALFEGLPPEGIVADPFGEGDLEGGDFAVPTGPQLDAGPDAGPPRDIRPGTFTLEARLTADGEALGDGVKWRIFGDAPGADGKLPLLGEASGGVVYLKLEPGTYFIHAAYGRAGTVRRVSVTGPTGGQVVVLNAGGLRLLALNGRDQPLPKGEAVFDIYAPDEGGAYERSLLIANAPPGKVIGLTAGVYHVVSRYGSANAQVRADIRVDAGKLTEATIYQKAARLTLKLVQVRGGEALADTAWSVLSANGETVVASVGAFPQVVLAAGEYKAIARHAGKTYEATFTVEAAADRDVEVLLR